LFAQGSRLGGHALDIKNGKLKYVYNFVGLEEQIIESDDTVPTERHLFSVSFAREGETMPPERDTHTPQR
jgi:arylsulfatase